MKLLIEKMEGLPGPEKVFDWLKDEPGSFLLDSGISLGGLGAYSFIGCAPFLRVCARAGRCTVTERGVTSDAVGEPLAVLRGFLRRFASPSHPQFPFTGGAVGYLSYEYGAGWEKVPGRPGGLDAPDLEFSFYDGLLAFSHARQEWHLIANPLHDRSAEQILARTKEALDRGAGQAVEPHSPGAGRTPAAQVSAAWYLGAVERVKGYIASGDVYQVNLAQNFQGEWTGHPYSLFRQLRKHTPAPFAAYLSTSFGHILSCSPERFLTLRGRHAETRPIKGTRRRGANPTENDRLSRELSSSAKERAELLMIVDLERNDFGRVCVPGSIKVEQLYQLEEHPTVLHLVATVSGELRTECDVFDLLRATFPGGSITGAPKVRAMEIIRELEPSPRHVYTGAIGYLGFDGNCDFNIAIRTVVLRGTAASYHVGAGIVWDSDPESEYEETLIKGRALLAAFEEPAMSEGPQP